MLTTDTMKFSTTVPPWNNNDIMAVVMEMAKFSCVDINVHTEPDI